MHTAGRLRSRCGLAGSRPRRRGRLRGATADTTMRRASPAAPRRPCRLSPGARPAARSRRSGGAWRRPRRGFPLRGEGTTPHDVTPVLRSSVCMSIPKPSVSLARAARMPMEDHQSHRLRRFRGRPALPDVRADQAYASTLPRMRPSARELDRRREACASGTRSSYRPHTMRAVEWAARCEARSVESCSVRSPNENADARGADMSMSVHRPYDVAHVLGSARSCHRAQPRRRAGL